MRCRGCWSSSAARISSTASRSAGWTNRTSPRSRPGRRTATPPRRRRRDTSATGADGRQPVLHRGAAAQRARPTRRRPCRGREAGHRAPSGAPSDYTLEVLITGGVSRRGFFLSSWRSSRWPATSTSLPPWRAVRAGLLTEEPDSGRPVELHTRARARDAQRTADRAAGCASIARGRGAGGLPARCRPPSWRITTSSRVRSGRGEGPRLCAQAADVALEAHAYEDAAAHYERVLTV